MQQLFIKETETLFFIIFNHKTLVNMENGFLLIELWSTEKSYTLAFKRISLCSSSVKSFHMLSKQELYQLMLSFVLNLQISVSFTYK